MRHFHRAVLFILLIQFSTASFSQKKWTLDDCLLHAHENNIQLQQQELTTTLESYDVQHSRARLLPAVNLSSSQMNRFGRSVDPLTYDFTTDNVHGGSLSAYTDIYLFQGFRGVNQVKKDQLELQVQLAKYEQARRDLDMNITRNFLEILYLHEALTNKINQSDRTRQQIAHAQKLFQAGSLTQSAILDLEAQLSQEEAEQIDAQNQLDLSRLSLVQLLDIEDGHTFEIAVPDEQTFLAPVGLPDIETLYGASLKTTPYIRAAELSVNTAETSLRIARGYRLPELKMTGGWGTGYSNQIMETQSGQIMGFREQLRFNSTTYLGFQLAVPVVNSLTAFYQTKKAEIKIQQALLELDAERLRLRKDLEMLFAETRAAKAKWEAGENSLEAITKAFADASHRFDLGMITAIDFNNIKNKVSRAESELLVAKYRYIFSTRILSYYMKNSP